MDITRAVVAGGPRSLCLALGLSPRVHSPFNCLSCGSFQALIPAWTRTERGQKDIIENIHGGFSDWKRERKNNGVLKNRLFFLLHDVHFLTRLRNSVACFFCICFFFSKDHNFLYSMIMISDIRERLFLPVFYNQTDKQNSKTFIIYTWCT